MRFILAIVLVLWASSVEAGYTVIQANDSDGQVIADAITRYFPISGFLPIQTTESPSQTKLSSYNSVADKLIIYISINDASNASTATLRVDTADSALVTSITASTTGLFENTSDTASITAGNLVNYKITVPSESGNHSITIDNIYFRLSSATNTFRSYVLSGNTSHSYTGTTQQFHALNGLAGAGTFTATEQNTQHRFRTAGTFKKGFANVTTNSKASNTTVGLRINGADGNVAISITASTTGSFEDNSNTDVISGGELVNIYASNSVTGTVTFQSTAFEFETTNKKSHLITQNLSGATFTAATTYYNPVSGFTHSTDATVEDTEVQLKSRFTATVTNLQIYLTANAATGNGTFDFRKNGASGNNTVSVTASTTGLFEDTTHSDSVAIDDLINYRFVVGSGGTSTVSMMGSMIEDTTVTVGIPISNINEGIINQALFL